jgi:hypothetical protein
MKVFITDDGFRYSYDKASNTWISESMIFESNDDGVPIDAYGLTLKGDIIEIMSVAKVFDMRSRLTHASSSRFKKSCNGIG